MRRTSWAIREQGMHEIQGQEPEAWKVQEGLVLGSGSSGRRQAFVDFTRVLCQRHDCNNPQAASLWPATNWLPSLTQTFCSLLIWACGQSGMVIDPPYPRTTQLRFAPLLGSSFNPGKKKRENRADGYNLSLSARSQLLARLWTGCPWVRGHLT